MVRQLLYLFLLLLLATTGLPNKLTLYLKELEVSVVKSLIVLNLNFLLYLHVHH